MNPRGSAAPFPEPAVLLLLALSGIGMGLAAAMGGAWIVIAVSLALPLAVALVFRPEFIVLLYIFLTVSVFNIAAFPQVVIGGLGRIYLTDALLICSVLIFLLRFLYGEWIPNPLTWPLMAYVSVRGVSLFYSAAISGSWRAWVNALLRSELPLVTFVVLLAALRRPGTWQTFIRCFLAGGIMTLGFYFLAAVTRNQALLSSPLFWLRSDVDVRFNDLPRIVSLGLPLVYPLYCVAVAGLLSASTRTARVANLCLVLFCLAVIILHGFRGMWYASAAVLPFLLLFCVGWRKAFGRILLWTLLILLLVGLLVLFVPSLFTAAPVTVFVTRAIAPFTDWEGDFSFTGRLEELRWGWSRVLERPILGWGVMVPTNPVLLRKLAEEVNAGATTAVGDATSFVHIGYLSLLLNYGFLGLLALLLLVAAYFRYARATVRLLRKSWQRTLVTAFMGYTVLMLLIGLTNPSFSESSSMVLLSVGFAITVAVGEQARHAAASAPWA